MQFDVIIGNPPYQLNDGGGTGSSAIPIYQKFIEKAKQLNPRYLIMVVPSRWFSGGRGLDEFRDEMLNDKRIRVLHDYPNSDECFSGVSIEGGVCYFLWDRDKEGLCKIYTHEGGGKVSKSERLLLETGSDTFVRFNEAIPILRKINKLKENSFADIISANDPFGFDMREDDSYKRVKPTYKLAKFNGSVKFYYNGWKREGLGYIEKTQIRKNLELVKCHKV
jgi:site-specific DNA-methyltransferase (adenine-specific)